MQTKKCRRALGMVLAAALVSGCIGAAVVAAPAGGTGRAIAQTDSYSSARAAGSVVTVNPVTGVSVNPGAHVDGQSVDPLGQGLTGLRITLKEGQPAVDHSPLVFEAWTEMAQLHTDSLSLTGSTGLVMYVDTPSANKLYISPNIGNQDLTLRVGFSYWTLPVGGEWTEKSVGKGTNNEYVLGSVEFEDAFTGWVYIPWDTFYADNFTLDVNTHTMARITAVPQKLGNDASYLTFGPLYLEMEDGGKLSLPSDGKIQVSPFEGVTVESGYNTVDVETVTPLNNGLTAGRITLKSGQTAVDNSPYVFSGSWEPRAKLFPANAAGSIADSEGLVVYVELPTANSLIFSPTINTDSSGTTTDLTLKVGASCQVLPAGGSEWTVKTISQGYQASADAWGCVTFEEAFTGWVYIPWGSLTGGTVDLSTHTLARITMLPQKLGGDAGSLTFGPLYLAADGGLSLPADNVRVTSIEGVTVNNSAQNVSTEEANPLGNGMKASRISTTDADNPLVAGDWFTSQHGNRAQLDVNNASVNGSTGLVFYVDLPSANKVGFIAGVKCNDTSRWNNEWDPDLMQRVGSSYSVLASGADEWEERTAVRSKADNDTWWGCAEFDSAFNGYVFIPWESLGHDGGFVPNFTQDTLLSVKMYPQRVGGEAGVLTFGPLFMATEDGEKIDNSYLAPNRWRVSSFPETTSPTVTATTKGSQVTTETIPSPIPAMNQNDALRITLNQAWELEGAVYSLYDVSHWTGFTYASVEKAGLSHLMFYVKNTAGEENYLALKVTAKSGGGEAECRLGSGKPYQLLSVRSDEWEHCEALRSVTADSLIALPAGFEGFVKVPLASIPLLAKDTSLSSITAIQFAFAHAGGDGVIVSSMLGVTQDSDSGPTLPAPTTDKIIQPVEAGDIFSQRVMLYWEAFPNAHHYRIEAYQTVGDDGSTLYTLVSSREAFTTSGTVMDLTAETAYAMVVKAYDAHNRVIAIYAPVSVTTAATDPYAAVTNSDAYTRDPVYYPATPEETTTTSEVTTTTSEVTTTTSEETTTTSEETTTTSEETTTASEAATTTAAVQPSTSGKGDSADTTGTTQANTVNPPKTGYSRLWPFLLLILSLMSAGGLAAAAIAQKRKDQA